MIKFLYLFKLYQNPYSVKMLDPDPHKTFVDPTQLIKYCITV